MRCMNTNSSTHSTYEFLQFLLHSFHIHTDMHVHTDTHTGIQTYRHTDPQTCMYILKQTKQQHIEEMNLARSAASREVIVYR
jgi:hypothetical protein